jgi:hypothetical protein
MIGSGASKTNSSTAPNALPTENINMDEELRRRVNNVEFLLGLVIKELAELKGTTPVLDKELDPSIKGPENIKYKDWGMLDEEGLKEFCEPKKEEAKSKVTGDRYWTHSWEWEEEVGSGARCTRCRCDSNSMQSKELCTKHEHTWNPHYEKGGKEYMFDKCISCGETRDRGNKYHKWMWSGESMSEAKCEVCGTALTAYNSDGECLHIL